MDKTIFSYITDTKVHQINQATTGFFGLDRPLYNLLEKPVNSESDLFGTSRKWSKCNNDKFQYHDNKK